MSAMATAWLMSGTLLAVSGLSQPLPVPSHQPELPTLAQSYQASSQCRMTKRIEHLYLQPSFARAPIVEVPAGAAVLLQDRPNADAQGWVLVRYEVFDNPRIPRITTGITPNSPLLNQMPAEPPYHVGYIPTEFLHPNCGYISQPDCLLTTRREVVYQWADVGSLNNTIVEPNTRLMVMQAPNTPTQGWVYVGAQDANGWFFGYVPYVRRGGLTYCPGN
jgi:hypothetical protein